MCKYRGAAIAEFFSFTSLAYVRIHVKNTHRDPKTPYQPGFLKNRHINLRTRVIYVEHLICRVNHKTSLRYLSSFNKMTFKKYLKPSSSESRARACVFHSQATLLSPSASGAPVAAAPPPASSGGTLVNI